ncbi:MAG: TonB-dependent receptor [Candidatus Sulfotelmatobacter sp.]
MRSSRRLLPGFRAKKGGLRPGFALEVIFSSFLLFAALYSVAMWGQEQVAAPASGARSIHGIVKSGNMPIPGAGVSATNAATKEQVNTWTDVDGSYVLRIPADGKYSVRVQMAAFAGSAQEVTLDATHPDVQQNFELVLQSRAREARSNEAGNSAARNGGEDQQRRGNGGGRGFQSLSVSQSGAGQDAGGSMSDVVPSGMPVPGIAPNSATESVAVSGNTSNSFNAMSADEMQERFNEARQQGGGFGDGGGFRGGGGRGGFGGGGPMVFGRRGFDINRPHGSVYYGVGDAALNASPFSITGQPVEKPGYLQNSFGGSVGGPLNIPHIYHGGTKTFYFVNFNGKHGENPFDQFSTVPTLQERQGNFSGIDYTSGLERGQQVELFNPATNAPFLDNQIPLPTFSPSGACIPTAGAASCVALGLLNYIPLPNLANAGTFQNFHFVTSAISDSDDLNVRVNHSFGAAPAGGRRGGGGGRNAPRNSLQVGFHYHQSSANLTNPFPSVGGSTTVRSFDVPVSYTRSKGKLTNIVRADFNRSRTHTQNLYAFNDNITNTVGITGVSQNPFDWGLPTLSFTNFGSLQDITPALTRNQTYTFTDNMIWNHGKHTLRWGADFRRVEVNPETDSNPRGSFVFSGLNTSQLDSGNPVAGTGYDFADFLLGLPQQTSEQFGQNNHFRGNFWDLYAQDEWKMRGNLTLNLGVRYEYVSPLTEINNRIVNLDLSPGVLVQNPALALAVTPIQPGQAGPYSGPLPASLVRPDRNNFAPRVGFAWKPFSKTVVRGGYGINYNTGAYQGIAQQLAFQPPFSTTATNVQAAFPSLPNLTLQSGFPAATGITNDYAVNPNYRLGYVQIRNLDIQQQIRPTILLNIDYTGTKGTDLDILEAPNRTATGIRISGVQAFTYESSVADSEANAGTVRLRKRLAKGFSIGGTYTFSKALDDASSIGGGATSGANTPGLGAGGTGAGGGGGSSGGGAANVAQNPFNLSAERGLSSFNQTHKFSADYLWELPFGHDKRWLTGNTPLRAVLGDWQWSGDWTFASGLPFTPRFVNDVSDVNAGTNATLRPDLVPGQSVSLPNPSIAEWFNTAAFVAPPTGEYGNARRNSLIGPGSKVFDMAFTKIFPMKESRLLEFRAQATNIFNMVNYSSIDTSVTSPTFGRVTAAGAMRAFTITSRFRF